MAYIAHELLENTTTTGQTGHGQPSRPRMAFFLPALTLGGVEKNFLRLASAFAGQGHAVDLVLTHGRGELIKDVPACVNVIELRAAGVLPSRVKALLAAGQGKDALLRPVLLPLKSSRILRHLPALAEYLRQSEPTVLIAGMPYPNLVAVLARHMSASSTRIVLTERNTLSQTIYNKRHYWRWRYLPVVIHRLYPQADRIIAVSDGVGDNLARTAGLPRSRISTVFNPVVVPQIAQLQMEPTGHAWLADRTRPVILAAGRMTAAKGFDVLIRAFAQLRAATPARLLILGDGPERKALAARIAALGVEQDVDMPGFAANPYSYMARAALFVLSSRYEGLPTVLIEALACGCPVVSTNCPSGPEEILEGGRYGPLVPVDDAEALAAAMSQTLDNPLGWETLRGRAQAFSLERSLERYREVCFGE
jgi:glycosyltransferase involved in cell wall biosynthesis